MSIQISEKSAQLFSQGDWRRAIALMCNERTQKATKALQEASPSDCVSIAKLQEEIRQLDKLSCIEGAVIKFEEKQAASKLLK